MSYEDAVPVDAGQDLSAAQYKVVGVGGTIAETSDAALGILQNKPRDGEDASVGYSGRLRYRAGGAVVAGNRLLVTTSGWITAAGSNEIAIGTALGAVGSGGIGEGIFNFAGAQSIVGSGV